MVAKRRGVIVSKEFVKPKGFDVFVPKGSKALKRAEQIAKQKLIAERKQAAAKKEAAERQSLAGLKKELIKILAGEEKEVRGRYKMQRFILKSNGKRLQVFVRGNPNGQIREVKNLEDYSFAIRVAAKTARLLK